MSNLDKYISKLLVDDKALEMFINDPKGQSNANGLSKADGAILRRSVHALPATAKSGLSIKRPLSSYRSSIRLLQNVLHNHHGNQLSVANGGKPTILIYYNDTIPNWAGAPFGSPHQAYVKSVYVDSTVSSPSNIGDAMGFTPKEHPNQGDTVSGTLNVHNSTDTVSYTATYYPAGSDGPLKPYITEFVIDGNSIKIPFDFTANERKPFWFYSLNGSAIVPIQSSPDNYKKNPDAKTGEGFESFIDYQLTAEITNITWQAIAPDMAYGFAPCFIKPYQLGIPVTQRSVHQKGETFYTNSVSGIFVDPNAYRWMLSSENNGEGKLRTDDVVEITITSIGTSKTIYSHDYSTGCSTGIIPTAPVDITDKLTPYNNTHITLEIKYKDQCGTYVSSSGYFLVQQ
ncbi:MAG: hypothetical protein AAFQ94_05680 [Bacteroidota bacterium]